MQLSTVAVAVTHSNNRTSQKLNTLETPQEYLYFNWHIVVVGECMVMSRLWVCWTHTGLMRTSSDIIRLIEFTCSLSVIRVLVTLVYWKYVLEYLVRLIMHNANSCFTCRECTNCTHSFPKLGWFLTYCCGWTKVSANWSQNSLMLATVIFWRVNQKHCL